LVLTGSEKLSKNHSIVTIISAFRDKNDDAEVKQLSGLLNASALNLPGVWLVKNNFNSVTQYPFDINKITTENLEDWV
jgi:hypothetical protein